MPRNNSCEDCALEGAREVGATQTHPGFARVKVPAWNLRLNEPNPTLASRAPAAPLLDS